MLDNTPSLPPQVMILEKHEFLANSLNTGWLDVLIAKKEQADKPNKMLSLICGALNVADQCITSNFQSFKTSLERGQVRDRAENGAIISLSSTC